MSTVIVDTAALAVHLKCTPAFVRRLSGAGIIRPVDRTVIGQKGRPSMRFDIDEVDDAIEAAVTAGIVLLDQRRILLRK